MSTFIMWFTLALKLIGPLKDAVKAVEEAIPGAGQGASKLAAILDIAKGIAAEIGSADLGEATIGKIIQVVVDALVKLFNGTGVFSTSNK